jgi:uncharacterized protein YjgD (DUF1641 family)
MAQPIPFTVPEPKVDSSHEEAIQSALELLQLLHDRGVLNLLRGLVGAGDQVVDILTSAIDTREAIRGIRNFLLVTKIFASIPPEVLNSLIQAAETSAEREKVQKAPSLLHLVRRLNSENCRHALAVTLDLVEGVGKQL